MTTYTSHISTPNRAIKEGFAKLIAIAEKIEATDTEAVNQLVKHCNETHTTIFHYSNANHLILFPSIDEKVLSPSSSSSSFSSSHLPFFLVDHHLDQPDLLFMFFFFMFHNSTDSSFSFDDDDGEEQESGITGPLIGKGPTDEQWQEITNMIVRLHRSVHNQHTLKTMKLKLKQDAEPEKEDKFHQKKRKADIHILEYKIHEENSKQPFEVTQERLIHKLSAFQKDLSDALDKLSFSLSPSLLDRLFSFLEKKLIAKSLSPLSLSLFSPSLFLSFISSFLHHLTKEIVMCDVMLCDHVMRCEQQEDGEQV